MARILALVLLIVIFSETLGPEEFPRGRPVRPSASIKRDRLPEAKTPGSLKPQFPIRAGATIDEEAFIASFRRQAPNLVTPCLRTWQSSPGSMMVSAVLTKAGKIEQFKMLDTTREWPSCLSGALASLNFSPLVTDLDRPSIEIRWRMDW